jgi:hypothetical protein
LEGDDDFAGVVCDDTTTGVGLVVIVDAVDGMGWDGIGGLVVLSIVVVVVIVDDLAFDLPLDLTGTFLVTVDLIRRSNTWYRLRK